jgi:hypothetical protein
MRALAHRLLQLTLLLGLLSGSGVFAEVDGNGSKLASHWYAQAGAYVHWSDRDDFEGPPLFGGIEYNSKNDWLGGFSLFNNSFGQFSQYLYLGKKFRPWKTHPEIRIKLTAGVVQGYKDEHYDTLPVRWGGSWGLGFVPAIGYQKNRIGYDVAVLGVGGLLFLVGYAF